MRKPLVEAANARAQAQGLKNVAFFYANAHGNVGLVGEHVHRFYVQFPDPCFKKRHWKRRIVQPAFVREMVDQLPIGGQIFAQSDVLPLAQEMDDIFTMEAALERAFAPGLHHNNPFQSRTEWERHHETEGEPVYRMLYTKVRGAVGPVPGGRTTRNSTSSFCAP